MDKVESFIAKNNWIVAKTMQNIPHEYVCKTYLDEKGKEEFEYFVKYIRANGFDAAFFNTQYRYLKVGEYYYWTMGCPLEDTRIINRASDKLYEIHEFPKNGKMIKYMYRRKGVNVQGE